MAKIKHAICNGPPWQMRVPARLLSLNWPLPAELADGSSLMEGWRMNSGTFTAGHFELTFT